MLLCEEDIWGGLFLYVQTLPRIVPWKRTCKHVYIFLYIYLVEISSMQIKCLASNFLNFTYIALLIRIITGEQRRLEYNSFGRKIITREKVSNKTGFVHVFYCSRALEWINIK